MTEDKPRDMAAVDTPSDSGNDASNDTADESPNTTRRALLAAAGAGLSATAGCAGVYTPADASSSVSIAGNVAYFSGPEQIEAEDPVFLDARSREQFRTERIYGARHAPVEALTTRVDSDRGRVPDADAFATALGEIGLSGDEDVVVYGSSVGSRVTRVAFALEYLGHEGDVRVLNGGIETWTGRLGTGDRNPPTATYDASPNDDLVVTRDWLADRVGTFNGDGPGLVDVRPPEAYLAARGSSELVASNDRQGHLPGAIDVHWVGNVAGRTLTDPGTLASLYFDAAGLGMDDTIVVYGQGNVNPTNTWLALRALGATDVRLYDGGFAEWANVPDAERGRYPVETKTTTVVETEGSVGGSDEGGFSCTG
jgi:thiosulfate/3-mercaptopyruvate sulfurtransferase